MAAVWPAMLLVKPALKPTPSVPMMPKLVEVPLSAVKPLDINAPRPTPDKLVPPISMANAPALMTMAIVAVTTTAILAMVFQKALLFFGGGAGGVAAMGEAVALVLPVQSVLDRTLWV